MHHKSPFGFASELIQTPVQHGPGPLCHVLFLRRSVARLGHVYWFRSWQQLDLVSSTHHSFGQVHAIAEHMLKLLCDCLEGFHLLTRQGT